MKALAINGSPRLVGNTTNILMNLLDELNKEGFETEQVQIYEDHLNPCNDCGSCEIRGDGRCINEDDGMNDLLDKMRAADIIILGSPSYFGGYTAQLKMFTERAGYCLTAGDKGLRGKIGAAVAVQDRDGGLQVYNQLCDWMLRMGMCVVGSDPLPVVTAKGPVEWMDDKVGQEAIKNLAQNIVSFALRD